MRTLSIAMVWALFLVGTASSAEEKLVVAGAGPSTQVVAEFFIRFADQDAATGYSFVVPSRSIKHAGGIRSTESNLFGRTGRPLTPEERGDTKLEIPLGRIPLAFVRDPDCGVKRIDHDDLVRLLEGSITNWQQLGGVDMPVRLVGREKGEAARRVLQAELPVMAFAEFDLLLKKDHQLVELLDTRDRRGVLGFGAASNFRPEQVLEIAGLEAGATVGLVYDLRNVDHPLVDVVREFAASSEWSAVVSGMGYFPPTPIP